MDALIIVYTTHRINYTIEKWHELLNTRGFFPADISKINNITGIPEMQSSAIEIQ